VAVSEPQIPLRIGFTLTQSEAGSGGGLSSENSIHDNEPQANEGKRGEISRTISHRNTDFLNTMPLPIYKVDFKPSSISLKKIKLESTFPVYRFCESYNNILILFAL
jgi:hypothetical protein